MRKVITLFFLFLFPFDMVYSQTSQKDLINIGLNNISIQELFLERKYGDKYLFSLGLEGQSFEGFKADTHYGPQDMTLTFGYSYFSFGGNYENYREQNFDKLPLSWGGVDFSSYSISTALIYQIDNKNFYEFFGPTYLSDLFVSSFFILGQKIDVGFSVDRWVAYETVEDPWEGFLRDLSIMNDFSDVEAVGFFYDIDLLDILNNKVFKSNSFIYSFTSLDLSALFSFQKSIFDTYGFEKLNLFYSLVDQYHTLGSEISFKYSEPGNLTFFLTTKVNLGFDSTVFLSEGTAAVGGNYGFFFINVRLHYLNWLKNGLSEMQVITTGREMSIGIKITDAKFPTFNLSAMYTNGINANDNLKRMPEVKDFYSHTISISFSL